MKCRSLMNKENNAMMHDLEPFKINAAAYAKRNARFMREGMHSLSSAFISHLRAQPPIKGQKGFQLCFTLFISIIYQPSWYERFVKHVLERTWILPMRHSS